jgi:hypothetical protein
MLHRWVWVNFGRFECVRLHPGHWVVGDPVWQNGARWNKWSFLFQNLVLKSNLSYGDLNVHFREYVCTTKLSFRVQRKLHPSLALPKLCFTQLPGSQGYTTFVKNITNMGGWGGCDDKISNNPQKNKHHFMSPLSTGVIRGYMSCSTLVIQLKSSRGNQPSNLIGRLDRRTTKYRML